MIYDLINYIKQSIDSLGSTIVNYVKCRSMCCTNINIYSPCDKYNDLCFNLSCCLNKEMSNSWIRATTPRVESPCRRKN